MSEPTPDPAAEAVFGPYATYYDLIYRDKDYAAEAAYVDGLLQAAAPGARSVLDLGSGTGAHAEHLARLGYSVHGVDRSPGMLAAAQRRQAGLDATLAGRLAFSLGDVQTARVGATFDVVVSLFHVASYQIGNDALRSLLRTACSHLKPGGVFVFDAWYGPAVLTDPPAVRVKRIEDDRIQVTRLAEPVLAPNRNVVQVRYHVLIRDKKTNAVDELREVHEMRYLFVPEVELMLGESGFALVATKPWMTDLEPGTTSWNVSFTARRVAA